MMIYWADKNNPNGDAAITLKYLQQEGRKKQKTIFVGKIYTSHALCGTRI